MADGADQRQIPLPGRPPPPPSHPPPGTPSGLMAPLLLDLQSGLKLQLEIRNKFRHPVSFLKDFSQREFFLLTSCGRCKYRLDTNSMGSLLQAAIGGLAVDFNVLQLSDRVFRFSVPCRQVGFFIYQL
jgi:hypothetical protein